MDDGIERLADGRATRSPAGAEFLLGVSAHESSAAAGGADGIFMPHPAAALASPHRRSIGSAEQHGGDGKTMKENAKENKKNTHPHYHPRRIFEMHVWNRCP